MNDVIQLHPEDLLDKHYAGALTGDDRRRLDEHLEGCATCRVELALGDDLEAEEQDQLADLSHLVLGAVPAPKRGRLPGARWLWVLAAVVVAGSAGAAYLGARAGTSPPAEAPVDVPAPVTEAPAPAEPGLEARTIPPQSAEPQDHDEAPAPAGPAVSTETAASLFAAANAARRAGRRQEALRSYEQLQARFPESREARTSRAIVADLVADDDPSAAVAAYDEYLDEGGTLGEEALVGRAEALREAGRRAEEAASWRQLLARHPESIHAARARARLAAIAAQGDAP